MKFFMDYSERLVLRTTALRTAPVPDLDLDRMRCAPDRAGMNDPG